MSASPRATTRMAATIGVLQQKAARPGAQSIVNVLVHVEGGEHEHPGFCEQRVARNGAGGLDAVHFRHADVHEYHVGPKALRLLYRIGPVSGLADDLDALVGAENGLEAAAHEILVVHDEHADGIGLTHGSPPSG